MELNRLLALSGLAPSPRIDVLNEAQDYKTIFTPLMSAFDQVFPREPDYDTLRAEFRNQFSDEVKWARAHMRRADAIVWYLRWSRFFIAKSYAGWDDFFKGLDSTPVKKAYEAFAADFRSRGGIENIANIAQPRNFQSELEHLMSLNLRGIQSYRFDWQLPDEVIAHFKAVEEEAASKIDDAAEWRLIDPDMVWRTDDRAANRRSAVQKTEPDYHAKEQVLMTFPDGTFWLMLNRAYCPKEADAMVHCGNAPRKDSDDNIISLRRYVDLETKLPVVPDREGDWRWLDPSEAPEGKQPGTVRQRPELTFILYADGQLGEMKALKNNTPGKRFHDHVVALMRLPMIKGVIGDGYAWERNFHLSQLPAKKRESLLADKPELDRYSVSAEDMEILGDAGGGWQWAKVPPDFSIRRRLKWNNESLNPPATNMMEWWSLGRVVNGRWEHRANVIREDYGGGTGGIVTLVGRTPKDDLGDVFDPIHRLIASEAITKVRRQGYSDRENAIAALYANHPERLPEVAAKIPGEYINEIANKVGAAKVPRELWDAISPDAFAKDATIDPAELAHLSGTNRYQYWTSRLFKFKNIKPRDLDKQHDAEAITVLNNNSNLADIEAIIQTPEDMERLVPSMQKIVYVSRASQGKIRYDELPDELRQDRDALAAVFAQHEDDLRDHIDLVDEKLASDIVARSPSRAMALPPVLRNSEPVLSALFRSLAHRSFKRDAVSALLTMPPQTWPEESRKSFPHTWGLFTPEARSDLVAHVARDPTLLRNVLRAMDDYLVRKAYADAASHGLSPEAVKVFGEWGAVPIGDLPPELITDEAILKRVKQNSREANQVPLDKWHPQLALRVAATVPVNVNRSDTGYGWTIPDQLVNSDYLSMFVRRYDQHTSDASRQKSIIQMVFGEKPEIWAPEIVVMAIRKGIIEPKIAHGDDGGKIAVGRGKYVPINDAIAVELLRSDPTIAARKDLPKVFQKVGVLATAAAKNAKVLHYLPKKLLSTGVVQQAMAQHASNVRYGPLDSMIERMNSLLDSLPRAKWGKLGWKAAVLTGRAKLDDVPKAYRTTELGIGAVKAQPLNLAGIPDPAGWAKTNAEKLGFGEKAELMLARGGVILHKGEYQNAASLPKQPLGSSGWHVAEFKRSKAAPEFFFFDEAKRFRFALFVHPRSKALVAPDKKPLNDAKDALKAWIPTVPYDLGDILDTGLSYSPRFDSEVLDRSGASRHQSGWGGKESKLKSFTHDRANGGRVDVYRSRETNEPVLRVFKNAHHNVENIEVHDWKKALEANDEIAAQGGWMMTRLGLVTTGGSSWSSRNRNTINVHRIKVGEMGPYSVWMGPYPILQARQRIGLFGPTGMIAHAILRKPTRKEPNAIYKFEMVNGFEELETSAKRALSAAAAHVMAKSPYVPSELGDVPVRVREAQDERRARATSA